MKRSSKVAAPARSAVVTNVDGTHMGLAVNWWSAVVAEDQPTVRSIRDTFPAQDVLRSAVEIILAQATWLTRAACRCGFDPSCPCSDSVHLTLCELATDRLVDPKHQAFCADLAETLESDPGATDLALNPIPVSSLMDLVVFLGSAVEYRHGVPVAVQLASFRRQIINSEGSS